MLPHFEANLPPAVKLDVLYDRSQTIRASVNDVQITLLIAGALVVVRDLRLPAHASRPPSFPPWRCPSP